MATAIALSAGELRREHRGWTFRGVGAWATTDTTGTIAVPFKRIETAEISSNDTALPVAHAISKTLSSNTLAISRAAGGTSAAGFSFTITGS
jgi:hypothetical protein